MRSRGAFALLALLPACFVGDDPTATDETGSIAAKAGIFKKALAPGDVKVWKFDDVAAKGGIDPRFEKGLVKNAKNVSFKQGPNQQITMTCTNEMENGKPGQADIQLVIADVPATGGDWFKGWLNGNVLDSNNSAIGFCGSGGFEKGEFHTQLQMAFMQGGKNNGLCYCNLCPAKDGHGTWCATDQWQVGDPEPPKVSGAGACKAPGGTTHVVVTLEAVAKGDANVHRKGTAVFKLAAFGRCQNDGDCPDAMIPKDYGN